MRVSVVVVGTSLGGLSAMRVLLAGLPREFRPPIVIVQHRGKTADDALLTLLRKETFLSVCEPNDKEPLESGRVYIAPADYHLLVERNNLALSTEAPVNHARPSIDILFESAAESHGRGVVGVVLTGANEDGATGAARIKERGGVMLVQDAASAEAPAMPAAAIATTNIDKIVPLAELAAVLSDLCAERGK
jgi:two-component system chemotaxis response regulator CheB